MADEFDYCAMLVRAADKDRFLTALYAPERYRRPLHALYAFNVEIGRVREQAREPMPGEIRLQWWRDVLAGASAGSGEAGPIAAALNATIVRYRLPLDAFMSLIEARSFDLYDDPMDSLAALEGYAEKTSSAVMALAAQILNDGNDPGVDTLTRHAGVAFSLMGLLDAFPLHARRRQLYLPLDLLQRHGARTQDVFARVATPALRMVLGAVRKLALDHLAQLRAPILAMPSALVPALLPAALVRPALRRMERADADPFILQPLPQWRRQWVLWRAARHPRHVAP